MATKKTPKNNTPIDQRETFVSIQKNFAESSISIEEQLQTLADLQKADTAIDKIVQLRGELPLEVASLQEEIEDINRKIAMLEQEVEEFTASVAANKNNMVECSDQIAKYREHIDNITNSREYDSLQKEIENQELLYRIAEKRIGEAREAVAERRAEIENLKDRKAVKDADLEAKNQELATIVESTAKEEEALRANRDACAAKIDERTMNAYEKVRGSYVNQLAVVPLYKSVAKASAAAEETSRRREKDTDVRYACGGCMNIVPSQRVIEVEESKKIIICEYCGRILVKPALFGEE